MYLGIRKLLIEYHSLLLISDLGYPHKGGIGPNPTHSGREHLRANPRSEIKKKYIVTLFVSHAQTKLVEFFSKTSFGCMHVRDVELS